MKRSRGWVRHQGTHYDSVEAAIAHELGELLYVHADGVNSLSPYQTEPRPEWPKQKPIVKDEVLR